MSSNDDGTTTTTSFGPSDSSSANSDTMSAATVVNVFTQAVIQTGTFPDSLDGAPDIGAHQATAKEVANSWIDTVRIQIYQTNTNLGAYATKFQNFYDSLYSLAGDLTDENKVTFTKGLNLLKADLSTYSSDADAALTTLQDFNKQLTDAVADMTTDNTNITATYDGDQGELADLQNEIDSAQKARSTDISIIAGGCTGAVVGGLLITVGVLGEFETGGASTALIVAGLACEAGAGTAIGIASADLAEQDKTISDDTSKLAKLRPRSPSLTPSLASSPSFSSRARPPKRRLTGSSSSGRPWRRSSTPSSHRLTGSARTTGFSCRASSRPPMTNGQRQRTTWP